MEKLEEKNEEIAATDFKKILSGKYDPKKVEFIWKSEFQKHISDRNQHFSKILRKHRMNAH